VADRWFVAGDGNLAGERAHLTVQKMDAPPTECGSSGCTGLIFPAEQSCSATSARLSPINVTESPRFLGGSTL
jgi:hypothetical protein